MSKIIHFIVVIAVLVISAGAARAELYGLANEEVAGLTQTNTARIISGESSLYLIDPDTGAATLIGPTGFFFCEALDFHPITNVLYAGCYNDIEASGTELVLVTIDVRTGKGTEIGPLNANGILQDFSFDGHGTLFAYFVAKPGNFLATIDLDTGEASEIGSSGLFGAGNGIGFGQQNELFLAQTDMIPSLYLLNQSSGLAGLVTDLTVLPLAQGVPVINSLDLNPETNVMFGSLDIVQFSYNNFLITIDTSTGLVTDVGETVEGLKAIAFINPRLSNIPTMSEYGMAAVGLSLLSIAVFVLYRRKKVAAV